MTLTVYLKKAHCRDLTDTYQFVISRLVPPSVGQGGYRGLGDTRRVEHRLVRQVSNPNRLSVMLVTIGVLIFSKYSLKARRGFDSPG